MSELRVVEIHNPNDQTGGIAIDNDDNVTINSLASVNGGPLAGFRNQIINGAMGINQRHGLNNPQTLANGFAVDRWRCTDGTNYSQQSSTNNWDDGFDNHILINSTGNATIYQHIELDRPGVPMPFAVGTRWTLSAYVAANQATFNVQPWIVFTDGGNGTGNQTNVHNPAATEVTTTGTALERVSWDFTVGDNPAASNTSLTVFLIGSNLNGSLSISGVQLEPGPVATPFEQRPIGTELALCQRYFHEIGTQFATPGFVSSGSNIVFGYDYPAPMRANPQLADQSSDIRINNGGQDTQANATPAVNRVTTEHITITAGAAGNTTSGRVEPKEPGTVFIQSGSLWLNAEL